MQRSPSRVTPPSPIVTTGWRSVGDDRGPLLEAPYCPAKEERFYRTSVHTGMLSSLVPVAGARGGRKES